MEMMMKALALLLSLTTTAALAAPACEPPDTSWHMLERQQDGGIASVLHGLSKHECEFAKARIEGTPATEAEVAAENQRQDERGRGGWSQYMPGQGSDSHYDYSGSGDTSRPRITRVWNSEPQFAQTVVSAECFQ